MLIDIKKIIRDTRPKSYGVKYIIYQEKEGFSTKRTFEELREGIENAKITGEMRTGTACFYNLLTRCKGVENRILFKVDFQQNKNKKLHLSKIKRLRWVILCKQNNLMPKHIGRHFIDTGNYILNLENISLNKTYALLLAARFMQENPETVATTLYLHSLGLDFLCSLLVACRLTVINQGHSFFYQGSCLFTADCDNANIDLSELVGFKKFLSLVEDKSVLIPERMKNKRTACIFSLQKELKNLSKDVKKEYRDIKVKDLFTDEMKRIVTEVDVS